MAKIMFLPLVLNLSLTYAIMYTYELTTICMKARNFFSLTEARKNLFKIADEVQKSGNHYTLTEKGKAKVVVMSAEQFESWQETLEVMAEMPDLIDDIRKVEEDERTGKTDDYITLEELILELKEKENALSSKNRRKSGKANK